METGKTWKPGNPEKLKMGGLVSEPLNLRPADAGKLKNMKTRRITKTRNKEHMKHSKSIYF